jgi:tRNA threonylcarbamoyl adenosine modification protein YeaZ
LFTDSVKGISLLIAIDTSTDIASLALVSDGLVLSELTWRSFQNHTIQLTPNIEHLLRLTGTNPKTLTAVVVAQGPGSFNGLRVGVSVAKGLAFSLNIPIVGISSLEVEAYQYADACLPVCPIFNAGRDEVVAALYRKQEGVWQELVAGHITKLEEFATGITEKTLFCGEHVPQIASKLGELLGDRALFASPVTDMRRASFLAELGMKRLAAGQVDNAATLTPVYLRRPPIGEKKLHPRESGEPTSGFQK